MSCWYELIYGTVQMDNATWLACLIAAFGMGLATACVFGVWWVAKRP